MLSSSGTFVTKFQEFFDAQGAGDSMHPARGRRREAFQIDFGAFLGNSWGVFCGSKVSGSRGRILLALNYCL